MKGTTVLVVAYFALVVVSFGQEPSDVRALAQTVAGLSPHVAPAESRPQLRTQIGRQARQSLNLANQASSAAWKQIDSLTEWQAFRDEKLDALRRSLGKMPSRPATPRLVKTGEIHGDGFTIQNLVYESRPGIVVTANLYAPAPLRERMPAIIISHSHHNPKEQGELQDMGMLWARAGCYVLVPDHLGHGERRQHPFASATDYPETFQVGRQDYYFRYDTSMQLYLVGETLTGWMVHDLMTGVDVLLSEPSVDRDKVILLGSVAGGGDPAAVTAALDERISAVAPFNFGGPQPETRYPLPDDAETSFNYAGGGSWESTRNLYRSAADGFLPWVIGAGIAPRRVVHAHEFAWDRERDPVWRRYQQVWSLYDAGDRLAFAHGHGTLTGNNPAGSHCNNIGAVHRRQIHSAFSRWFGIDAARENDYSARRSRDELICLTEHARHELKPRLVHQVLAQKADENLATARQRLKSLGPDQRIQALRRAWNELLGESTPLDDVRITEGAPATEQNQELAVSRELIETEPEMMTGVMTLSQASEDRKNRTRRPLVIVIDADGIAGVLARRSEEIANVLRTGAMVALVEPRGVGDCGPGDDHGQQSTLTSNASSELMLGRTLLGGQLRDLRTAVKQLRKRSDIAGGPITVVGGSGVQPLATDAAFAFPRRVANRPQEAEPAAALLALLLALFEDDVSLVSGKHGLASYRSVLDSAFVQVPLDTIVPGMLAGDSGDLSDLVAALAPRTVTLEALVDGLGRLVPQAAAVHDDDNARRRILDFVDPTYGGRVRQIFNATGDEHDLYHYRSVFNADNSRMLGIETPRGTSDYRVTLYDREGIFQRALFTQREYDWTLAWDRRDPRCFYTRKGSTVFRFDVESGQAAALKTFERPALTSGPSGLSLNQAGDRILLRMADNSVRTYRLPELDDERVCRVDVPEGRTANWDKLRFTGYRSYFAITLEQKLPVPAGARPTPPSTRIYDGVTGELLHEHAGVTVGHHDFSNDGKFAYVEGYFSRGPEMKVHVVNLDGSDDRVVFRAPREKLRYVRNYHITWPAGTPEWFLLSFFPQTGRLPPDYEPYLDELIQVFVDGTHKVLARTGTTCAENFWAQPQQSVSADGTRVLFHTNATCTVGRLAYESSGTIDQCILFVE